MPLQSVYTITWTPLQFNAKVLHIAPLRHSFNKKRLITKITAIEEKENDPDLIYITSNAEPRYNDVIIYLLIQIIL